MTDTTWSVGLPSLSAATQVPANFFRRSRLGAAPAGALPGVSSPRVPPPSAMSRRAPAKNRCVMSFSQEDARAKCTPHQDDEVYCCPLSAGARRFFTILFQLGADYFTPLFSRAGSNSSPAFHVGRRSALATSRAT